jgi:heme oxygenase
MNVIQPILIRLKQETHADHVAAERALALHRSLASLTSYRRLIERFWGFYTPLEARLAAHGEWAQYGFDIGPRLKAPALARDLQALDRPTLSGLPCCDALPPDGGFLHALGCMYVLEGATLGGQIIARQAHAALGVTAECGGAFFASYGRHVGPMWRSFQELLVRAAVDEPAASAIVCGAHDTFRAFGAWLAQTEP